RALLRLRALATADRGAARGATQEAAKAAGTRDLQTATTAAAGRAGLGLAGGDVALHRAPGELALRQPGGARPPGGVRLYRLHGHPGSGCPDLRSKGPHPRERRPPLVLLRAPLPLAHAAIDAVGGDVPRQQRGRDPLRLGGPPLRAGPGVRARRARPDRGRRRRWRHLPLIRWLLRQLVELVLEQLVLLVVRLVGMVGRRRRLRRRRRHLLLVTGGCSLIDLPDRQPRSSHTTKATRLDPVDQS